MMKFIKSMIMVLMGIYLLGNTAIYAQIKVYPAKDAVQQINKEGVFYALPQTHIKIDVIVEKTEKIRGPLYAYADKYLGITGVQRISEVI